MDEQAKVHGKNVDYRHNVRACPALKHMFQPSVNTVAEWYEEEEQSHPFDMAFSEYDNQSHFIGDGGMLRSKHKRQQKMKMGS